MKTTAGEMKRMLDPVPDEYEITIMIPCHICGEFVEVEKGIVRSVVRPDSRRRMTVETEILNLDLAIHGHKEDGLG